jgi:hypothetical protein
MARLRSDGGGSAARRSARVSLPFSLALCVLAALVVGGVAGRKAGAATEQLYERLAFTNDVRKMTRREPWR